MVKVPSTHSAFTIFCSLLKKWRSHEFCKKIEQAGVKEGNAEIFHKEGKSEIFW